MKKQRFSRFINRMIIWLKQILDLFTYKDFEAIIVDQFMTYFLAICNDILYVYRKNYGCNMLCY